MTNLQKTIISLLCGFTIEKPKYTKLKEVFTKLDEDMDGCLSKQDLRCTLLLGSDIKDQLEDDNDQCIDVLEKCDLDGDGTLDFNEFIQAAVG